MNLSKPIAAVLLFDGLQADSETPFLRRNLLIYRASHQINGRIMCLIMPAFKRLGLISPKQVLLPHEGKILVRSILSFFNFQKSRSC